MKRKRIPDAIFKEAVELLEQSRILGEAVEWESKQIEQYIRTYSEERINGMGWEEKEEAYRRGDELFGRLGVSVRSLHKLNERYEVIRKRVNEFYGREVMKGINGIETLEDRDDIGEEGG